MGDNGSTRLCKEGTLPILIELYTEYKTTITKWLPDNDDRTIISRVQTILNYTLSKWTRNLAQRSKDDNEDSFLQWLDVCISGSEQNLLWIDTPFRLLDELFSSVPIASCKMLWKIIELRKDKLTSSCFIADDPMGKPTASSLALLLCCNGLLKRLSHTEDTVFSGKIMMFLAFAFQLAERSAVNLKGKGNIENDTVYESEEVFIAGLGSDVVEVQVDEEPASTTNGIDTIEDGLQPVDYKLYRVFWDLQRFHTNHVSNFFSIFKLSLKYL